MNSLYDTNNITIIAIIYCIGGLYSLISGIFAIANIDMKIPLVYEVGVFISNLLYGKKKTQNFENELNDPKKRIRFGIFMCLIGLLFLGGSVYLLVYY